MRLIGKFSGTDRTALNVSNAEQISDCSVESDGSEVRLELHGETHVVTPEEARDLRAALDDALYRTETFTHTACEHRPDGSYVVARRRADSSGHRKVFDSFATLRTVYDRLPREFTAEDVSHTGITGGRRHMLVRHLAEHPTFDCTLVCRQPLTARKGDS